MVWWVELIVPFEYDVLPCPSLMYTVQYSMSAMPSGSVTVYSSEKSVPLKDRFCGEMFEVLGGVFRIVVFVDDCVPLSVPSDGVTLHSRMLFLSQPRVVHECVDDGPVSFRIFTLLRYHS